jgi:hypothetical protein
LYFVWSMQLTELHLLVYLTSLKWFLTKKNCSDNQYFCFYWRYISVWKCRQDLSRKKGKNLMWRTGCVSYFSFSWRGIHGVLSSDVRRPAAWRSYRHFEGPCCFHLQGSKISCTEKDVKVIGTRRRSRSSERTSVSPCPLHRQILINFCDDVDWMNVTQDSVLWRIYCSVIL